MTKKLRPITDSAAAKAVKNKAITWPSGNEKKTEHNIKL